MVTYETKRVIRGPYWGYSHSVEIRPAKVCTESSSEVARDLGFRVGVPVRQPR